MAHNPPTPACDRFFAIPELCEQLLQHTTSTREIFRHRHVCRAWKLLIENSTPLKQSLFLVSSGSTQERWKPPGGINDLFFAGRPAGMIRDPRDAELLVLYCKDPDTTRPPTRPALEKLDAVKTPLVSQMFLTQPPVSKVHATWDYDGMYMKMELDNPGGVKVEDLIGHLEEFGRSLEGERLVGMELVALCVECTHTGRKMFRRERYLWKGRDVQAG